MNWGAEWLTKGEVALRLKKSERTIERWQRDKRIRVSRIGHSVLYEWEQILGVLMIGQRQARVARGCGKEIPAKRRRTGKREQQRRKARK